MNWSNLFRISVTDLISPMADFFVQGDQFLKTRQLLFFLQSENACGMLALMEAPCGL